MSDGSTIRRYRRKTSLGIAEIDRWQYSVLVAILVLLGMAGIILAVTSA